MTPSEIRLGEWEKMDVVGTLATRDFAGSEEE